MNISADGEISYELDLHELAIWNVGYMLVLGCQRADAECKIYFQGEYKGNATQRLQSILMEPTISAYVGNLTSRVVKYIQQNHVTFGIPATLTQAPGGGIWSREFSQAIGRTLTVFRAKILKKIRVSLAPGDPNRNIEALTNHIAPSDFIAKKAHWTCIAFIHVYAISWLEDGKEKSFWKYIDEKIAKMLELPDHESITKLLDKILLADQKKYPKPPLKTKSRKHITGVLAPRPAITAVWQRGTAHIVEMIEGYQVHELNQDDEDNAHAGGVGGELGGGVGGGGGGGEPGGRVGSPGWGNQQDGGGEIGDGAGNNGAGEAGEAGGAGRAGRAGSEGE
ncbi:hypothetical protein FRC10_008755 [Ceratobasidium sp. 414]|nr:hypothetical protein FRC10_008755 [Ceratobasidium sp. 414]